MKTVLKSACVAACFCMAAIGLTAQAEPYVDYTPQKGVWEVQAIAVDPNHLDDYLTGLKRTMTPELEIAKSHGLIDKYGFMVKFNSNGPGANVLVLRHYPSLAAMEPDKARDQMLEKEYYARISKDEGAKKVAEYEKYRKFVSDEFWTDVDMTK